MKPKSPISLRAVLVSNRAAVTFAVALSSLLSSHKACAADITWSGATAVLTTASNWSGGVLPSTTADRWVFGAAGAGGTTLTGNRAFAGMLFNAGAPAYTIGSTSDNVTWNTTSTAITNNSSNVQTINYNLAMAQARIFTGSTAGGNIIANGLLSGGGNITKSGTNTLTITNAGSTLSNNFIVSGGTLNFGAVGTIGARSLGAAGVGTFTIGGTLAAAPGVTLTANSAINNLTVNAGAKFTMVDSSFNTFEVRGATANGYAGAAGTAPTYTFDIGGTGSADVLAFTGTPTFTNNGAQLLFTPVSALTVGNSYTIVTAAGGLNAANGFILGTGVAVFGNTSYTLGLNKTPTVNSIQVLAADLARAFYSGAQGTTLNAGSPGVSTNWLDAASGGADTLIQPSAATELHFAATGATNTTIATLGQDYTAFSLNFNNAAGSVSINDTASNKITVASGGVNVTAGTHSINVPLVLSANQSFTNNGSSLTVGGAINASSSILSVTGTGPTALNGNITNSGGLTKDGAGTLTVGGTLAGTGGLVVNGGGSVILGSSNSYAGTTLINTGTVSVSSFAAFGTDTNPIAMSAVGTAGITYTGTGEITSRPISHAGALANSTTLTQSGTGLLKLTGNITVTAQNNRNLILAGSTAGTGEISGVISNQTINPGAGQNTQITKNGTGTWTLSGQNTYTNQTNLNGGTLRAGVASVGGVSGAFGLDNLVLIANAAGTTLDLDGFNTRVGGLSGGGALGGNITLGSATLTTGALGGTRSYSGVISGSGGLTKIGSGSQTLTAASTYSGATSVTAGTLTLSSTGSIANTTGIAVSSGATYDVSAVSGYTVGSSQTLSGIGNVTGATVIAGTHTPGVAGVGTQTFSSTLNYGTGSIFEWNLNAPGAADPGAATANSGTYGQVSTAGALTGGAAIYKVVLSGNAFSDAFWSTSKSWNNVFTGAGAPSNLASVFSSFSPTGGLDSAGIVAGIGQFTFNGATSTLNWTPVPEPTSALAGLLLGAGLLRRRRA